MPFILAYTKFQQSRSIGTITAYGDEIVADKR
jgi:hypothetical protein